MNLKHGLLLVSLLGLAGLTGCSSLSGESSTPADLHPVDLRCEYRVSPLGIDEAQPRLTWRVESKARAQFQSAYRIVVASSLSMLINNFGDLWDTGKVLSDRTANVPYAGQPLRSRETCYWKVQVWDRDGKPASWSATGLWTMGLLHPEDWQGHYISYRATDLVYKDPNKLFLPPARQYRKEFQAPKSVRRATLYATALGIYELHLNGRRIGDAWFAPGWTDYHQRAYYWTYDVTSMLERGTNALGAWVADGWYSGYIGFGLLTGIGTEHIGRYTYGKTPSFLAQLEIEFTDGTHQTIVTDPSWKVTGNGPIQEADFLMGEKYDARQETPGWTRPGFDDSKWDQAIPAADNGSVKATFYEFQNPPPGKPVKIEGREVDLGFKRPAELQAFPGEPVRALEQIKPVAITEPKPGTYIFNLGQNFAGVIRLRVPPGGKAGDQIQLRYGEMLYPDGRLMTENLRKARAQDFYILKGDPPGETYTPRFTFHGFQYVEISGLPGKPDLDAVTGLALHSDTPPAGAFECSDPVVNQLYRNIVWTQRANFLDLPTDCPQRDERFGWTGDAQIYVRAATYNADVAAFYTKWIRELMESQRPSGVFPGYAPYPFQHGWDFGTAWCDAGVICPWTIYHVYGDRRIIERCWGPMVKFLDWRQKTSRDHLGVVHGNDWGDWLSLGGKTPLDYIDTVYFAYTAHLMAEMAKAIGKTTEAAHYTRLFDQIREAFQKKYLKADGSLTVDTQTAYVLALYMDLVPDKARNKVGEILAEKILAKAGPENSGIATGFLGTRPLLPVLSAVGRNDLAVRLIQSRKFPSWGYEVEQGATTVWERWNSYTKDKGFGGAQNASMNSFAHYSFGAVCEWLFFRLAGIDTDGPGYDKILIRPSPPDPGSNPDQKPIDWVKAHYDSIHGRITSNWKREGDRFELEVALPANTSATVYLPADDGQSITESDRPLNEVEEVKLLLRENNQAVLSVPSGTYRFVTRASFGKAQPTPAR
jgi:alpha-L-rhamnosidase